MSGTRQQVNLYQPGANEAGDRLLSARTAALLGGAVSAWLLAVWLFGWWRVEHLERAIDALHRQQQQQDETMARLAAARAAGVSPEQMQVRVQLLASELKVRSGALTLLSEGSAGRTGGFSERLTAFAHRTLSGLWIDHLALSGMNDSISISGAALNPDLIPLYLRGLGAEASLAGTRFDDLVIERPGAHHRTGSAAVAPDAGTDAPPGGAHASAEAFTFRAQSERAADPASGGAR
ncbi:MAG TPA: hypothetical protein VEH00_13345 [Steroidobacteraceae bacterium]|nr:hypothetical protein [Steroidobacteraceae bacterium]